MIYEYPTSIIELSNIYQIIKPIGDFYPKFQDWFFDKVITGVSLGNDKVILAKNNNDIVGVSIIKDTTQEKKLRAIRILPEYQKKGYGMYLIDKSLDILNCDKPCCSVAEEMFHEYARIFVEKYHFNLTHVHKNLYRKNKLEYSFNENLNLKYKSINF